MSSSYLAPTAVLAMAALTLTACGGDISSSTTTTAGVRAPTDAGRCTEDKAGGTITMGEYVMLPSFAPGQGQYGVRGGAQSAAVYDRLMRWDPETTAFEPKLAESLESSQDNTVWTLTLRDGVRFSNGDPLTADDVAFTVNLHQDPAIRSTAQTDATNIERIRVLDPLTIEFTLTESWADFPAVLAGTVGEVIPEKAYLATSPEEWARSPIGAGAFILDNYIPDQESTFKPNPEYYGGPVCPSLRFIRVPGSQGTYDAFQTGELEVAFIRGAKFVSAAKDDDAPGFEEIFSPGTILNMNTGVSGYDGVLTDESARQAVSYALDRDLIDQRVTGGLGFPASTLLDESSRFYDGQEGLSYDRDRATQLISEVKNDRPDWDGELTLLVTDSPENTETGVVAKALLDAAGFNVTIETVPISQVNARQFTGDYEIVLGSMPTSDADPASAFASAFVPGGAVNLTGIDDPELTKAVTEFKSAADLDGQKAAYTRLQDAFNKSVPFAVIARVPQYVTIDESAKGIVPTLSSTMLFDGAYLDE